MRLSPDWIEAAWIDAAGASLDARLLTDDLRPVAVALSGGGDSLALLRVATDWAARRGRSLLALSVDHGLNPDSADWMRRAHAQARAAGADWRGLTWDGPKPATGLPAAARAARHRMLAEAARGAGARVVLIGHTADDVDEGDWMRARGGALGRLRDWSPSPVWPEGRGLALLRPLLGARRAALREWLAAQGLDWIDDPANADPRFARSRARAALAAGDPIEPTTEMAEAEPTATAVESRGDGVFSLTRDVGAATLARVLLCAGGGETPPRGERLARLVERLGRGEDFSADLAGSRLTARGAEVLAHREAGAIRRGGGAALSLRPGMEAVWDGRYAVTVEEPGWRVHAAQGFRATLSGEDRAWLKDFPSAARSAQPVLIRDGDPRPLLAARAGLARSLAEDRLALARGMTTHERDL